MIDEGLHDAEFVAHHTVGFDALAAHVRPLGPEWAAPITGVPADRIVALARRYATTRPAMILLGGSSMHKGGNGWQAAARDRMPAGARGPPRRARRWIRAAPRSVRHGQALSDITEPERRPPGATFRTRCPASSRRCIDRRVRALLLFGTDMLSSYRRRGTPSATGLARRISS